jgi:hypothetical protein
VTAVDFQRRAAKIDGALTNGRIDEAGWYARVRELIEAAYLSADSPQGQSGLGGDAAH